MAWGIVHPLHLRGSLPPLTPHPPPRASGPSSHSIQPAACSISRCTLSQLSSLLAKGSGPYFYLPKTQSWEEAAWWSDVFSFTEDRFDLPRGTIKATVLIETLPAVFQMDEILYHLRDHRRPELRPLGLHLQLHQTLENHGDRVLPDRQSVTWEAFPQRLFARRSKPVISAARLPWAVWRRLFRAKTPEKNDWVLNKVRADKELEASNGHDGTWVSTRAGGQ